MKNNVIELRRYRRPEPFDFSGYNRRAELRFRRSELRAWILCLAEAVMTLGIGVCAVFCVYLAITML